MKNTLLLLAAALASTTISLAGCASTSDGASAGDESNLTAKPEYDAVKADPTHAKNTTDTTITATQSFSAHSIAFFGGKTIPQVSAVLVDFSKWTEIVQADNTHPFIGAVVHSDTTDADDNRTITGTFQLANPLGGAAIPMDMKAEISTDENGDRVVSATNTTPVKMGGLVLADTGKVHIDVIIGSYPGGVIVDSKMSAKASNLEAQAAQRLSPLLPAIVKWSQSKLP